MQNDLRKWIRTLMTRFSPRKRWKVLRICLRLCSAALVLTIAVMLIQFGPHGWSGSPVLNYAYALLLFVWLWNLCVIPFVVRWMDHRLRWSVDFFQKQVIAFVVAFLLPAPFLAAVLGGVQYLVQNAKFHLSEHPSVSLFLTAGFSTLALLSFFRMAKDLSDRMQDSLRVLVNGMSMASQLDFDHPITAREKDEIGHISGVFNNMAHNIKTKVNLLHALYDNTRIFSGFVSAEKILDHTPKTFKSIDPNAEIVIALLDESDQKLVVTRTSWQSTGVIGLRFGAGEGVFGRIIREQQFLIFSDEEYAQAAKECGNEAALWGKPDFTAAVPMLYKKGMLKGAVALYNIDSENFQLVSNMDYFQALANQIANFLENARLYGLVIHDRLTGLYVHSYIEAELTSLLARAKTDKFPVSFVMFDVDKFKGINDRHGHPVGNQLLIAVAQIIRNVSREMDLPARFGGDEFEIVLPRTDRAGALVYAEKLRKTVEDMELSISKDIAVHASISVGVATYPQDAETVSQLQSAADKALYVSKEKGRNAVTSYSAETDKKERRAPVTRPQVE